MKTSLKVMAATICLVIGSQGAGFAATSDSAALVMGTSATAIAGPELSQILGGWHEKDLMAVDKAANVTLFDIKSLYKGSDLSGIQLAIDQNAPKLAALHDAIRDDEGLTGWMNSNDVKINDVVLVYYGVDGLDLYVNN